MKATVVSSLERLCSALGHPFGCALARLSDRLDQRWGTHVWGTIDRIEHPDVEERV